MPDSDKEITIIGKTNFRDRRTFGIKREDRRKHIYIVGKTGTGKSTLMENMLIDDIREGKGVGLIDPHGDFAQKVLDFVPEERIGDVIYFNPSDVEYPIGFNPLEAVGSEHRHLVASGIMGVFKKVWPDVWSNRMEYLLNNTLLALLEYPGSTLLGVIKMLTDKKYREKVVENLSDPVVKTFWTNEFAKWTDRYAAEATPAVLNKIGQLIANPLIRHILGQPHSTINIRDIMDEKKIFIINLAKGSIGEDNSSLLGAMFITKLQMAAMSRVDIPEEEREDFFLYIDEFQNFSTDSFADIMSEARKYRLSLVLTNQYLRQLIDPISKSTKVKDAIFGNVGTIVTFRIGAEDAEFMELEFEPEFLANDLVNLPLHTTYIKLMIDGVASKPFSADTFPPHKVEKETYSDLIIENSRKKYGVPLSQVKARIDSEYMEADKKVEERGRRRDESKLDILKRPPRNKKSENKKEIDKDRLREALEDSLPKQDGAGNQ
ncbi:type IV secretion system DNA-binding domain-containing protein [Patescibacteria group bacterium]|nr:type IV secretion system DNA-binding domain-containing protein [Patescibacteria group bacterium]